jgi:hypothetical protein
MFMERFLLTHKREISGISPIDFPETGVYL